MITVEEASYFAKITKAHAILCGEAFVDLVNQIQHEPKLRSQFKVVPSRQFCMTPVVNPVSFTFCSGRTPDQNKPALVIFTSGSTGPPKGAVVRRYNIYVVAMNIVRRAGISKGYTAVQLLPMHQSTGLLINTIPVILGGGSIEFNEAEFNAVNVWERFRQGGITSFSGVPVMFRLLLSHWENVLSKLSDPEREPYQNAISGMREFNSSGFPLPRDIGTKWVVMTRGVPILERYGGTEFGPVYASLPGMNVPRVTHAYQEKITEYFRLIICHRVPWA
jgi:malonyl-CoA/methylmalonyl-CoA synthetase